MPQLPGINHERAVRALEKAAFRIVRQGKHRQHQHATAPRLSPLRLAFLLTLLLAGFALLPRVTANPWLAGSFWGATGVLLLYQLVLRRHVARTRRALRYEFVPPQGALCPGDAIVLYLRLLGMVLA